MYKGLQILVFLFLALNVPVCNFAQNTEEILLREISSSKTEKLKIEKLIELHNFYSTTNRQKWFESIDLLNKESLKIESEELKGRLFLSVGSAYLELGNIPDFKKCYELNIANKKFLRFEDNHVQRQLEIEYLFTKKDALASNFSLKHIARAKKNKQNKKTKNVWSSSEFSTNNKERVWKIITSKKKIKHKESSIKWSKNSNPNTKFKSKIWKKSSAFSRKTPCLLRKL
jgi:hypothetical protein